MRDRTSMFEYCTAPEHQKWMNEGAFDGGKLDEHQRALWTFYRKLLTLSSSHKAFSEGDFYDLQYINRHGLSEGFDEKYIYAYIRYCETERILVVVNFHRSQDYDLYIKIPDDAFNCMNLRKSGMLTFRDLMSDLIVENVPVSDLLKRIEIKAGLHIQMKANSSLLLAFNS
jgi:hypothetical protein